MCRRLTTTALLVVTQPRSTQHSTVPDAEVLCSDAHKAATAFFLATAVCHALCACLPIPRPSHPCSNPCSIVVGQAYVGARRGSCMLWGSNSVGWCRWRLADWQLMPVHGLVHKLCCDAVKLWPVKYCFVFPIRKYPEAVLISNRGTFIRFDLISPAAALRFVAARAGSGL